VRFRYRLAASARRDLQEISDYWTSEAGEHVALQVIAAILETVITISRQPKAGVIAEAFGPGVRKFLAGNYMLYYQAYRAGIEILHVFHGKRDQPGAWNRE